MIGRYLRFALFQLVSISADLFTAMDAKDRKGKPSAPQRLKASLQGFVY